MRGARQKDCAPKADGGAVDRPWNDQRCQEYDQRNGSREGAASVTGKHDRSPRVRPSASVPTSPQPFFNLDVGKFADGRTVSRPCRGNGASSAQTALRIFGRLASKAEQIAGAAQIGGTDATRIRASDHYTTKTAAPSAPGRCPYLTAVVLI